MTEGDFPSYSQMTNAEVFAFTRLRRVQMLADRRNHIFGKYGPTQYGKRAVAEFIAGVRLPNVGRIRSKISKHLMLRLWAAQEGLCYICGIAMKARRSVASDPFHRTVDHVTPISRGGKNHGNILLAHKACNEIKSDRAPTAQELATLRRINVGLGLA